MKKTKKLKTLKKTICTLLACVLLGTASMSMLTGCDNIEITFNTNRGISNDIFSAQISLDGNIYTLPCDCTELIDNGWSVAPEYSDKKISANDYKTIPFVKGDISIKVQLYNPSKSKAKPEECDVCGLMVDLYAIESGLKVILPGKLEVTDELKEEDVINKYGEPQDNDNVAIATMLTYKNDESVTFIISFSGVTGEFLTLFLVNSSKD